MIRFKRATFKDFDAIKEIASLSFPYKKSYASYYLKRIYSQHPYGIIVAKYYKVVGYVIYQLVDSHNLKIISLAVAPRYRQKEIGKALLNFTFKYLKETKKVDRVFLHVRIRNKEAIMFYNKLHFKIAKRLKRYYTNRDDAYLLEKLI